MRFKLVCLFLLSGVLVGCTSLTSLYFVPRTVWIQTPQDVGLVYEDVYLTTADDHRTCLVDSGAARWGA